MMQPSLTCPLQFNGRESGRLFIRINARLHNFDFDFISRLIIHSHGTMKPAAIIVSGVYVSEKVFGGDRRPESIDFSLNASQFGLDNYGDSFILTLRYHAEPKSGNHNEDKGERRIVHKVQIGPIGRIGPILFY